VKADHVLCRHDAAAFHHCCTYPVMDQFRSQKHVVREFWDLVDISGQV
jgi:hypothetical protein